MRLKRYTTGVAIAAILASSQAFAQEAPAQPGAAAGQVNPAAEAAPLTASRSQFQLSDGIIATVNDSIITGYDLRQRMLLLILETQIQPTPENLPALQQQALNDLIEQRLKAAELARYRDQLPPSPDAAVDQQIASIARQAGAAPEEYVAYLQQVGVAPAAFRESLRTEMDFNELVGGRFGPRSRVSRSQVEAAMRQLAEASSRPQYLVGEIYIDAARYGGQQSALNGAQQLIQQILQGAPFQNVARQFSSAPSAAAQVAGDAGWIVQGSVQPALQQVFDVLEPGQLSNPIPVEGGVYIIYMRDKRSGADTSLVQLRQMMIELPETATEAQVAAATERLNALRAQLTCENILTRARSEADLMGSDLGEADVQNLAPQFQQVARSAEIGTISTPVRTPLGLHLLAVCDRRTGGPDAPTFQQVENRLRNQAIAMLERRYMRDLRADSLIEIK